MNVTPEPRRFVASFPAALRGALAADRTAHARRVRELALTHGLLCAGMAGAGGFTARMQAAACRWDPRKIAGCTVWIGMQEPNGYAESGGTITQIINLASGVAWNTGFGSLPGFSATALNNRPGMTFNGTSQGIGTTEAAVVATFTNQAANTVFVVHTLANLDRAGTLCGAAKASSTQGYKLYIEFTTGAGNYAFEARPDAGIDQLLGSAGGTSVSGPAVVEFTDTGSAASLWRDGTNLFTSTAYTGGTSTPIRFAIGAFAGATNNTFHSGNIGGVVAHSRVLSADERSYLRVGLGNRWGFAVTP